MKRLYIMLLAVLLPLIELAAQQEVAQEDTTKQKPFFNALDYSLQKRYRARKYPFKNERFMDNTYVSVQMGMEDYLHRPGQTWASEKIFPCRLASCGRKHTLSGQLSTEGGRMPAKRMTSFFVWG